VSCLALRLLMLTVARTSEVRLARFDEIQDGVWILCPERTKNGREHRIPLGDEAIKVIELTKRKRSDPPLIFTGLTAFSAIRGWQPAMQEPYFLDDALEALRRCMAKANGHAVGKFQ